MRGWEYILEIPFESKKVFFPKSDSKYQFKGKCYFLIDKNGNVLRDFVQVDKGVTFRPNDNDMMMGKSRKGTGFWNSKTANIRREYFPSSPINKVVKEMPNHLIEIINKSAIDTHSTALTMEKLISGSNTSGAKTQINATPFWCVDPEFYGIRFTNPLKNTRVKERNMNAHIHYPITEDELSKSIKLSLKEYFKQFPAKRKHFVMFNPDMHDLFYGNENVEMERTYIIDMKGKFKEEAKSYNELAYKILDKYEQDVIDRANAVARLRGIFRSLLLIEFKGINKETIESRNENPSNMDAAHLIPVHEIKETNDLTKVFDKDNGLLLPKDIHWKFDKDKSWYIDEDYSFTNGKEKYFISKEYLNERRKDILDRLIAK